MKTKQLAAIVLLTATLLSCRKEVINSTTENQNTVESILTGVNTNTDGMAKIKPVQLPVWQVGFFGVNGNDEAAVLKGFSFAFRPDNIVMASSQFIKVRGTWYVHYNNQLSMDFDISTLPADDLLSNAFINLSDNWTIVKQSPFYMAFEAGSFKNKKELRFDRKF